MSSELKHIFKKGYTGLEYRTISGQGSAACNMHCSYKTPLCPLL